MELSQQVCSLELAKRLKEVGVKQDAVLFWLNIKHIIHIKQKENGWEAELDENGNPIIEKIEYRIELGNPWHYDINEDNRWAAFTVAELGSLLPIHVTTKENEPFNNFRIGITRFISIEDKNPINNWIINYKCDSVTMKDGEWFSPPSLTKNIYDPNLANAMAKMLIHLIENNLWGVAP